jgi:predicted kinase
VLAACQQLAAQQPDSFQRYCIASGPPPRFTPAREALHRQIIQQQLDPYADRWSQHTGCSSREVHVVTGLPGSGKSSRVAAQLAGERPDAFLLDMDDLAPMLPEYFVSVPYSQYGLNLRNGLGAQATHREKVYLAQTLFDQLIADGRSVIMSYVGEKVETELALFRKLRAKGYQIFLHHVQVTPRTALLRVVDRFRQTGRHLALSRVVQLGNQPTDAYHQLVTRGQAEGLLAGTSLLVND